MKANCIKCKDNKIQNSQNGDFFMKYNLH